MTTALIVDDTKFMRNILKSILTRKGIEVVAEASNGREAVEKYKRGGLKEVNSSTVKGHHFGMGAGRGRGGRQW